MAKQRIVNTAFWDDSYISKLNTVEKLLFLYLLTNPLTNISGVYQISNRRIAFDTGIDSATIDKIIKRLSKDKKVKRVKDWIVLVNFVEHQNLNPKVITGIEREINGLPPEISLYIDYDRLSHLTKLNLTKPNSIGKSKAYPSLQEVKDYFKEKGYSQTVAVTAFEYYSSNDWRDRNNRPVKSWKQKMISVWFKPENKEQEDNPAWK